MERDRAITSQIASLDLKASTLNLETAKIAHQKMVEQLSMRTATVAQMAAVLMTKVGFPEHYGAKGAVQVAEEIMTEAEAWASSAKELQEAKDNKRS